MWEKNNCFFFTLKILHLFVQRNYLFFKNKLSEFESRNVELLACSTDSEQSHWGWLQVEKNEGGIKGITYPILSVH